MSIHFLQFLLSILFLTIIFLHLTKKNSGTVTAYGVQSIAVILILLGSFLQTGNKPLVFVIVMTLLVKVIMAPKFFMRLIRKYKLTFSVSTYLNMPLTLIVLAALTAIAHSQKISPLTNIIPAHSVLLSLSFSAILTSLFLIVNRKDALSQAIGILSLENSLVIFAVFAGLEQSPILQIGIMFDILIWLVIATVFISMIYQHFKSLDTSFMKHLKD